MHSRPFLLLASTILWISFAEIALRWSDEDFISRGRKVYGTDEGPRPLHFVLDNHLGYRPEFDGKFINTFGTYTNKYPLEKDPSKRRLLFIGDSVTRRGLIIKALQARYGADNYEYWNAGVTGYNTLQEVEYYKRFNRAIHPDHVILTFHWNDFTMTPVVIPGDRGKVIIGEVRKGLPFFSQTLFRHSYLYRLIVQRLLVGGIDLEEVQTKVQSALRELRDEVESDGAKLTVFVLPHLSDPSTWTDELRDNHRYINQTLDTLKIEHVDLIAPLEEALKEGIKIEQELGDTHHPSMDLSERFAEYVKSLEIQL